MSDPARRQTAPTPAEHRSARNEALWREVNNRIDEVDEPMRAVSDDPLLSFHCECGRDDCSAMIEMTPVEYREARQQPDTFAVWPGHEQAVIEHIVKRTDRYFIVDKLAIVERLVGGDGIPASGG